MQISANQPFRCLAPLVTMLIGYSLGALLAINVPTEWEDQWQELWMPRLLGMVIGSLFWASSTAFIRERKLHCGGTLPLKEGDRLRYGIGFAALFFAWSIMLGTYFQAQTAWLLVLMICILSILLGEVGWGNPFHFIYVSIGKLTK